MTERMNDWKTPESWKRITCIAMIHAGHKNKEITVAAQCSLKTVRTIRHEMENCDEDYEAVARRKQHNRRSDCDGDYEAVSGRKQHSRLSDCDGDYKAVARRKLHSRRSDCDGDYKVVTRRKLHNRRSDCDGDYEAVARRKLHSRRSDCICTAEFLEIRNSWKTQASELGLYHMNCMSQALPLSLHSMKTFATTHTSVAEVNCLQKRSVKIA